MSDFLSERDGLNFRYRVRGEGVPFVWQHGLGSDLSINFDLLPPPPGVRLIGLDARAHGETRPMCSLEKISIPQTVEDLEAWLDALGIEKAIIGGISMGAAIALRFALRNPTRTLGLILSRPAWLDEAYPPNLSAFTQIAALMREFGPIKARSRFLTSSEYAQIQRQYPDAAQILAGQFDHPRFAETFEKFEHIPASFPGVSRLEWNQIRVPTLILSNDLDAIHPKAMADVVHQHIPGSILEEVTSKSISIPQHEADVRQSINRFVATHLDDWKSSLDLR